MAVFVPKEIIVIVICSAPCGSAENTARTSAYKTQERNELACSIFLSIALYGPMYLPQSPSPSCSILLTVFIDLLYDFF